MAHPTCDMRHVTCDMQHTICHIQLAAVNEHPHPTCNIGACCNDLASVDLSHIPGVTDSSIEALTSNRRLRDAAFARSDGMALVCVSAPAATSDSHSAFERVFVGFVVHISLKVRESLRLCCWHANKALRPHQPQHR